MAQGHSWLSSEFKVRLDYVSPCPPQNKTLKMFHVQLYFSVMGTLPVSCPVTHNHRKFSAVFLISKELAPTPTAPGNLTPLFTWGGGERRDTAITVPIDFLCL